jgi:hypothetical protein
MAQRLGHPCEHRAIIGSSEASDPTHCQTFANRQKWRDEAERIKSFRAVDGIGAKVRRVTTLVALQPSYLPWLGYFDQLQQADIFIHLDDVQFDKHGWRNRNRLLGPRGAVWLTVPIRHSGRSGQRILDVEIDDRQNWRRKHLSSVQQFYARAPYLGPTLPALEAVLNRPWQRLIGLNLAVIDWLAAELGVHTPRHRSSELGLGGERNDRLINLCRHFGATKYLSGDAAHEYLDTERFAAEGIEVVWQKYVHPTYSQLHGDFVPYLSVLDLILNEGPRALEVLCGSRVLAR